MTGTATLNRSDLVGGGAAAVVVAGLAHYLQWSAVAAFGFAALTLVFSPMLVAAVVLFVLIAVVITVDGESNWIEGAALIGVYVVIAASFWWG